MQVYAVSLYVPIERLPLASGTALSEAGFPRVIQVCCSTPACPTFEQQVYYTNRETRFSKFPALLPQMQLARNIAGSQFSDTMRKSMGPSMR